MSQESDQNASARKHKPRVYEDMNNGQDKDNDTNRIDDTGGGSLTRLQENAAKGRADEVYGQEEGNQA